MSAELAAAARAVLAHVRAYPGVMTRAEMDCFRQLAATVCRLAALAGWGDRLPQVAELAPALEHPDLPPLPPVQYETRLHLPGNWAGAEPGDAEDTPLPSWYPLITLDGEGKPAVPPDDDLPGPPPEKVFLPCPPR